MLLMTGCNLYMNKSVGPLQDQLGPSDGGSVYTFNSQSSVTALGIYVFVSLPIGCQTFRAPICDVHSFHSS